MAGRVLGQHHLPALAVDHAEVVNAPDIATGDHTIAAGREVNLLAHNGHRLRVFHQLRREQGDHVQRAPQDMALAGGEQVARLDRVIHDGQPDIKPFLREHALVIGLQPLVGHDDRRPAGPDVDGELDHRLAILHFLLVVAHPRYGGDAGALYQRGRVRPCQQDLGQVLGRSGGLLDLLLHLCRVDRHVGRSALRRDLVPPAVNAEANHGQQQDS